MATINISEQDHMQALYNLFREMSEATEAIIEMETVSLNSPNWARYHAAENMAFFLLSQYHKSVCIGDECEDNRREMINSIKKRTGCTDYHAGVIIDQLRAAA
jgi:hypothetical protein